TARWLGAITCNWISIGGVVGLCQLWPHWPAYVGAIILIGARQHALAVLLHEAAHYRVASNHSWNDFLSDWLVAYALLVPTEGYRAFHLKHHRALDTAEDPERITFDSFQDEWVFPMSRARFGWILLRAVSGCWPKFAVIFLSLAWNIPGRRTRHVISIVLL